MQEAETAENSVVTEVADKQAADEGDVDGTGDSVKEMSEDTDSSDNDDDGDDGDEEEDDKGATQDAVQQ